MRKQLTRKQSTAAKLQSLLGEVVQHTEKNLQMRVEAENGATAGKFDLENVRKQLTLTQSIYTVHEMAKHEARGDLEKHLLVCLRDISVNKKIRIK